MTNYVYAVFGDEDRHWMEFFYSLGTLLRHIDRANSRVVVFTDRPARLQSAPVTCEDIAGKLEAIQGPTKFPFRVKLVAILECTRRFEGNVFFLDSDTIVQCDLTARVARLAPGRGIMWKREGVPGWISNYLSFETKLPDGSPYKCSSTADMFNSGVVGLHPHDFGVLPVALALCDRFRQHDPQNRLCEQFGISEAMRIAGLEVIEAHDLVAHYYRASFRAYMHEHLLAFNARLSGPPWEFDRPIPVSYARVQWAKLRKKWKF